MYPKRNCYFCGGAPHNRLKCPARESVCHNCEIKGHFSSFINQQVANRLQLAISPTTRNISMALTTLKTDVIGCCTTYITLNDRTYSNVKLSVLKDLCSDIILGHDFQKRHKRLTIELHGSQSDLIVSNSSSCALATAVIDELFICKPYPWF